MLNEDIFEVIKFGVGIEEISKPRNASTREDTEFATLVLSEISRRSSAVTKKFLVLKGFDASQTQMSKLRAGVE